MTLKEFLIKVLRLLQWDMLHRELQTVDEIINKAKSK